MQFIRFGGLALFAVGISNSAVAADRASAAVELFRSFCLSAPPSFSSIDRKATEAGYPVFLNRDFPVPGGPGHTFKVKDWLVPEQGTPIMLTSADAANGPLHLAGCGFAAPDADGREVALLLTAEPLLGQPVRPAYRLPNGGTGVTWVAHFGPAVAPADSHLVLTFDVPGRPGPTASLSYRTHN